MNISLKHLLFVGMMVAQGIAFAQPNRKPNIESKKEKIEQLKIAFITSELELTTEQAEKFWPVYNEMADKLKDERKARKEKSTELKNGLETLSEADIKKKTNEILDSEIKEVEIKKDYNDKIAAIIGYKKATKLLSLEQRFKRELLNKLNERPAKPAPPGGQGQR